jgi:glycosyltransferase involved in cell wall biosynthesis
MRFPKISVITPSFNQARFLEATMESIHQPGYPNLEHIVIDGGSSDGSREIIESYGDRLAYWVSEPDEGQTDALIRGFRRATGSIQCWLNSDDLFESRTLYDVAEFFSRDPGASFVYGDSTWIDELGRVIKPKREQVWSRFVWLNDNNLITQPSALWRAGLLEAVGGLDPSFVCAMDADLWIRFAEVTRPRHVRRQWSRMRFYPSQKNTRLRELSIEEMRAIRGRYGGSGSQTLAPLKTLGARSLRVLLKAYSGGYSLSELARHADRVMGRGTWEEQESERSHNSSM